ncbi:ATP-binding cassette sub- F member 2 [Sorochytrium milnesiophthora]
MGRRRGRQGELSDASDDDGLSEQLATMKLASGKKGGNNKKKPTPANIFAQIADMDDDEKDSEQEEEQQDADSGSATRTKASEAPAQPKSKATAKKNKKGGKGKKDYGWSDSDDAKQNTKKGVVPDEEQVDDDDAAPKMAAKNKKADKKSKKAALDWPEDENEGGNKNGKRADSDDEADLPKPAVKSKKNAGKKKGKKELAWSDDEAPPAVSKPADEDRDDDEEEEEAAAQPVRAAKSSSKKKKTGGKKTLDWPETDDDAESKTSSVQRAESDADEVPAVAAKGKKKQGKAAKKKPQDSDGEQLVVDDDNDFGLKKSRKQRQQLQQEEDDEEVAPHPVATGKAKKNKKGKKGVALDSPEEQDEEPADIAAAQFSEDDAPPAPVTSKSKKNKKAAKATPPAEPEPEPEPEPEAEPEPQPEPEEQIEEEATTSVKKKKKKKTADFDFAEPEVEVEVEPTREDGDDADAKKIKKKKKKTGFVWAEEEGDAAPAPTQLNGADDTNGDDDKKKKKKKKASPSFDVAEDAPAGEATPEEQSPDKKIKKKKERAPEAAKPVEEEAEQQQPPSTLVADAENLDVIPVEEVEASPFMQEAGFATKSKKDLRQKKKLADTGAARPETPQSGGDTSEADKALEETLSAAARSARKTTALSVLEQAATFTHSASGDAAARPEHITATGQLLTNESTRDIQISTFSLMSHGQILVKDTDLALLHGRRYGLVGKNGCGKSSLLACLGHREVEIQRNVDIFYLDKEYPATEESALEAVVSLVRQERERLQAELDHLFEQDAESYANDPRVEYIEERMTELDLGMAEHKAAQVLYGLEFSREMMKQKTKEFSGGWRMRISLARALFVKPTLLLLDDPTSNLDMSACIWLEEYLKEYPHTLVIVSHSEDFLEGVCTDIVYMNNRKLEYYAGDYYTFLKVRSDREEHSKKRSRAEEKQLESLKSAKSKANSVSTSTAKQIKNKEKMLAKKRAEGEEVGAEVGRERELNFSFLPCGGDLPHPVVALNDVSFKYPTGTKFLFERLNFGIGLDCRIAIVGPNGVGKSTLLKLIAGALQPTVGSSKRNHHLIIARFHQHLIEQLNEDQSPVEFMVAEFPQFKPQEMRGILGRYGLTGKQQVMAMRTLSDGQKRRVVFAWLAYKNPHLLLLDEPSNNLDPETIDALANAINEFDGATVIVSHDFRLLDQVADEIWVVENKGVTLWDGTIREYKEHLRQQVMDAVENL